MKESLQRAFQAFARNERWGTCVACPRLTDGTKLPELCEHTERYDHQLTLDRLVDAYRRNGGEG